jgi:RNA polymerase sigma-70 factor (ECF subfamily)
VGDVPSTAETDERAALEAKLRAACQAGKLEQAATEAIAGYGPEILRYLLSLTRDEVAAGEVFSQFCENLWVGLPKFRWESSFRIWAYSLARHAWFRMLRDPHRRRERRIALSDVASVQQAAAGVRSRTATYLRTEVKDKISELRAKLDPDDQSLLILRINRKLSWTEIARVLADPDEDLPAKELDKRAAALRKRFQRIKDDLRAQVGKAEE